MSIKKFNDSESYNVRLYETEHFAVIPSLGSIVEGWLLIIPKEHYLSYGYIESQTLHDELNELIDYVGKIVKQVYGDYVIFENGAYCSNKLVGCGVDYAHIHIVPTKIDLVKSIKDYFGINYNWKHIPSMDMTSTYISNGTPYLYYRNQDGVSFIATDSNIPSQLFRKAIARSVGKEEQYDWKSSPFYENVVKSVVAYKQMFDKR